MLLIIYLLKSVVHSVNGSFTLIVTCGYFEIIFLDKKQEACRTEDDHNNNKFNNGKA